MANTSPPPLPCKSWEADMGGYRSHCWKGFFWKVIPGLLSRRFDWRFREDANLRNIRQFLIKPPTQQNYTILIDALQDLFCKIICAVSK